MTKTIIRVELAKLDTKHNIRDAAQGDDLEHLARSLEETGQLQPIGVVKAGKGWRCVYGHRRVHAATLLGWDELDAVELDGNENAARIAENTARRQLRPLELATAFLSLCNDMDPSDAAKAIGKSVRWGERCARLRDLSENWNAVLTRMSDAGAWIQETNNWGQTGLTRSWRLETFQAIAVLPEQDQDELFDMLEHELDESIALQELSLRELSLKSAQFDTAECET